MFRVENFITNQFITKLKIQRKESNAEEIINQNKLSIGTAQLEAKDSIKKSIIQNCTTVTKLANICTNVIQVFN